jgi:hypothetical protein
MERSCTEDLKTKFSEQAKVILVSKKKSLKRYLRKLVSKRKFES